MSASLTLDGVPLVEAETGLFFCLNREALGFRGDPPTWRNVRLSR